MIERSLNPASLGITSRDHLIDAAPPHGNESEFSRYEEGICKDEKEDYPQPQAGSRMAHGINSLKQKKRWHSA
jgi:hypothetical protein